MMITIKIDHKILVLVIPVKLGMSHRSVAVRRAQRKGGQDQGVRTADDGRIKLTENVSLFIPPFVVQEMDSQFDEGLDE